MTMLVNGVAGDSISALDRGLSYGDGVFRTMELRHGVPRLWRWQYARLCDDAARLALPLPDEALLLDELMQLGRALPLAVAKITLTRGAGARGYAMLADPQITRIVAVTPWAGYAPELAEHGVEVRWCDIRLSVQPRLAGIKHLNRLENVLARSEWTGPAIAEGLLQDLDGYVVEGTMSNVYLLRGTEIHTPLLDRNGVNGAVRDWLFASITEFGLSIAEKRLTRTDLIDADAVFLSNSLIGIWPVRQLADRVWVPSPVLQAIQHVLSQQA